MFRPGPFHSLREYRLVGDRLDWRRGERSGSVQLADIIALRLQRDLTGSGRSQCALKTRSGTKHVLSDRYWPQKTEPKPTGPHRFEVRLESFDALTAPLVRAVAAANPSARLTTGPGRIEWLASLGVALAVVAVMAVGAWLMIESGQVAWAALAFIGVAALQLPLLWPIIRTCGPRPLDPASLP